MIGKAGRWETSKPVAHTIASTAYSDPSTVRIPVAVTLSIPSVMTVQFGFTNASRYPWPGVKLGLSVWPCNKCGYHIPSTPDRKLGDDIVDELLVAIEALFHHLGVLPEDLLLQV